MPLSSDDESDSSENSATMENGNATKKPKIVEKDKTVSTNKDNDLMKKDKPAIGVNVGETIKDQSSGNKEVKTTTVMSMLRQQRDANILKTSSHFNNKGSKSTSSATSDDSSSSGSDSSDSSSDADRHSEEDDFDSVKQKGADNRATDNASNKIQINGTSTASSINNIPQEPDITFYDQLNATELDTIRRLIDYSKNLKENFFQNETLDLLSEYVTDRI